jgi:hypothetical protein
VISSKQQSEKRGKFRAMQEKMTSNEYRTTVVCVDEYDQGRMSGRIFTPYLQDGECFESLVEMLKEIDGLLDNMRFPQSFEMKRSFSEVKNLPVRTGEIAQRIGRRATFSLRVLFRQNASWQGSVTWIEGKMEESFRSVLELIMLMDSAMSGK